MDFKPFKSIAIGVAFSPNLEANINEASRLSLYFNSKLILIHVGQESKSKKDQVESLLQPFLSKGLLHELVFQQGDPVAVILKVTSNKNVDLLILGALQRESFYKYYVGSIARKITRNATCSVLLIINPTTQEVPYEHIVVSGLDEPETPRAVKTAFYIGYKLSASKITIVEEITKKEVAVTIEDDLSLAKAGVIKAQIRKREAVRVNSIIKLFPEKYTRDINIKSQPIFGRRGYSIGHYAQVARADLLVLTSPNKMSFWDRLFPHDIEHILTELPTDILILK